MITYSHLGASEWGRLGNQLFQIAATMGIAHRNGHVAVFPSWQYADYFTNPLLEGNTTCPRVFKYTNFPFKPIDLKDGDWDLQGFFPSEKYFESIIPEVRKQFEPSSKVVNYINKKYGSLLSKKTCSIHVRRGDYLQFRWSFPPLSVKYYHYAITLFPSDTTFLIFSDNIEWCKEKFVGEQFVFIENETDIIDLFLMSMCKNHIIANSTFSWWGAWLNSSPDKAVICPAWWYGPAFSALPHYISRDLYAHGYQRLFLPDEKEWVTKLYYLAAYPIYAIWSKIYTIMLKIIGLKLVKSNLKIIKKLLKKLLPHNKN